MKILGHFKKLFNQDRDLKLDMIRREMITDCFQSGLKLFAYNLSGSQALKAEMFRSLLDVTSHVFRISASYTSSYKPDDKYNYGYNLVRHLTIMTPGNIFMCSGIYHVYCGLESLVSGSQTQFLTLNTISLSAIAITSIGEFYLYYKNLGDINQDKSQGIINRIYSRSRLSGSILNSSYSAGIVKDTVITENFYSVISASVAVAATFGVYTTGLIWLDGAGQLINGLIQMKIGQNVSGSNSDVLIGKALNAADCDKVIKIISSTNGIEKVENLKSSWSVEQLRISAEIKLNRKTLALASLKLLEKDLNNLKVDQKELRLLLVKFVYMILTRSVEISKSTEEIIRETYEFAKIIDIEKDDGSGDAEKKRIVEQAIDEVLAAAETQRQIKV